jgi:hypothetical protein
MLVIREGWSNAYLAKFKSLTITQDDIQPVYGLVSGLVTADSDQ